LNSEIEVGIILPLEPQQAFDAFMEELSYSLSLLGLQLLGGPDGTISEDGKQVGKVLAWTRGEWIAMEWKGPDRNAGNVEIRFESMKDGSGTKITLAYSGLNQLLDVKDDNGDEATGWFASEVAAPLLKAISPSRYGDWLTDRRARRPSGKRARTIYRDPLYHRPNFKVILKELKLTPNDTLLEIGCGGGAFLEDALKSGCRAAAIGHSPEMVRLAKQVNREAIEENRLQIVESEAERPLPYPDSIFTCAVSTGVFGFIKDPLATLKEVHRVLKAGGRLIIFTGSKELRGTPAAPEPIASRIRFFEDRELEDLALKAGFSTAKVIRPDFVPFAKEVGIPEEQLGAFSEKAGQLLVACKKN